SPSDCRRWRSLSPRGISRGRRRRPSGPLRSRRNSNRDSRSPRRAGSPSLRLLSRAGTIDGWFLRAGSFRSGEGKTARRLGLLIVIRNEARELGRGGRAKSDEKAAGRILCGLVVVLRFPLAEVGLLSRGFERKQDEGLVETA